MLAVVLAGLLAVPIGGGARPASFKSWSVRWSARTARDNARVVDHCAKLFGGSDLLSLADAYSHRSSNGSKKT